MNKIKVLQIIGGMNAGGVEAFVMNYYRELHELCEFSFVCFDDSIAIPYEEIEKLGGKVFLVPNVKHLHAFNKALTKIFKENEFDIVHSELNTLSVFPLRIAKKCKKPIRIAHSHSISSKKEWKRNLAKSILRLFSKTYANVYFACGEATGRYQFGNKTFDKGQVTLIKNAINTDRFSYSEKYRNEVRKLHNIKENDYLIGTVGRFVETKNHFYFLKLAKANPQYQFMIVGNGPLEDEYNKFIKENNMTNVQVLSPKVDISHYYSAFDLFILPSFYEGFPMTSIEAQCNGLYILYSSGVPKEGLVTGNGKFIPIEDSDISKWSEEFNKKHPRDLSQIEDVRNSGHDIKLAARNLYEQYKLLLRK